MSFPWETPAQRRKREADEEFALREVFAFQHRQHVDKVNRATEEEINAAMAEILRKQRERNVFRPARRTTKGGGE